VAAQLQQHGGDRRHPACGAVRRLGAFQRRHKAAQVQHRRVEVAAVDEEVTVRAKFAGEHAVHRLRLHHREGRRRLDGHVDSAVLPELVPRAGQRRRRIRLAVEHELLGVAGVGVVGSFALLSGQNVGVPH